MKSPRRMTRMRSGADLGCGSAAGIGGHHVRPSEGRGRAGEGGGGWCAGGGAGGEEEAGRRHTDF